MSVCGKSSRESAGCDRPAEDTERYTYLSTTPARPRDWRLAGWVTGLSALFFIGALPFAHVPLPKLPAFVSSYESALAICDLITATLLFGKFTRLRSSALLALACGYLFNGFTVVPHALTFPGVFSPTGLLGAGSQSTAWLYVFWHAGFPLFVLAYALLRPDAEARPDALPAGPGWATAAAVVGVAFLVGAVTAPATIGMDWLPAINEGSKVSRLIGTGVGSLLSVLSLVAVLSLWRRGRPTVLDVWVMVVMGAWLFDVALSAIAKSSRYDLGWYVGSGYDLLAASFVLVVLLLETIWLHDRLATAQRRLADRARDLEQRVRQRTDELRQSNETLKSEAAERLQAEQELMRTRTFLDVIIDNVPAMLLLKDAKTGKIVYLNRAGEELTGIDRSEIVGRSVDEVMPSVDAKLIELQDRQLIESGKSCDSYENTLKTRNRGVRMVRTKKLMVLDEHGMPKYLLGFCEDVTEQREIEDQLRHAQKMEALGQLTGGLAHDFNNLLAIIIGNLDVLAETVPAGAAQELVEAATGAAIRGGDLTRRLLAFARRQPLRPEQTDANILIEGISRLLRRTLGENIEILLEFDRTIPPIIVDRVQLETAIANLANNARDAMPNGGRLIITTRLAALDRDYAEHHVEVVPGDYVAIEVSDAGEGMAPEVSARIFEPFFTTKAPGKGTGLGLSMVFGFMKQSGGHIAVYSEPGRGTTFRLYLPPATPVAAIETEVEAPPLQPAGDTRETILVVEDNAELRDIVVKQLRTLGFKVIEADNAQRALDIIAAHGGVDLLFSDVVLPGEMDGCALARKVAAVSPRSKILFTSGFPGARLTEMQGLDTSVRLLSKPYRKDELSRVVQEILAERPRG
jgi:PAS domain S-box-containing protein